jgi:hypothetical protein
VGLFYFLHNSYLYCFIYYIILDCSCSCIIR